MKLRSAGTLICVLALTVAPLYAGTPRQPSARVIRPAPILGVDVGFYEYPFPLIQGWRDPLKGAALARAMEAAGIRSLRLNFIGAYSPLGADATERIKEENRTTNQYPWFPLTDYFSFIRTHEFTTIVGVNVEEGADVAEQVVRDLRDAGILDRVVAVELSNEPHLNHRPWWPEEFADKAAAVIERLTPYRVSFALPLTVGREKKTPTRLSDTEWNTRMMRRLAESIDLRTRTDIHGVLHLYSRGMRARSIDYFNEIVRPFAPRMKYLVTEFNIRLSLAGNPHLTNGYGMEFARRLAEVLSNPDIVAMYVHAIPYHSVLYWTDGRALTTVIGHGDERLAGDQLRPGWHLTPAGRVYSLYTRVAWAGELMEYSGGGSRSHWVVRTREGNLVITLLNNTSRRTRRRVSVGARRLSFETPARSISCYREDGTLIEQLSLAGPDRVETIPVGSRLREE